MPIYEYECLGCGAVHEVLQRLSEPPLQSCPSCGKGVRKLVSESSFVLKGGGWYLTDYSDKRKKERAQQKKDEKKAQKKD
jgi:putative FmdB family regulatory protein